MYNLTLSTGLIFMHSSGSIEDKQPYVQGFWTIAVCQNNCSVCGIPTANKWMPYAGVGIDDSLRKLRSRIHMRQRFNNILYWLHSQ